MPKEYFIKQFHGTGKTYSVICKHGNIMIPKQIQNTLVEWYHSLLCFPGETRTINEKDILYRYLLDINIKLYVKGNHVYTCNLKP